VRACTARTSAAGGARHDVCAPQRRRRRALVLRAALLLATATATGRSEAADPLPPLELVAAPPTVTAAEVPEHRDEMVVLEAQVASARFASGRVVLLPADAPDGKVRIVLIPSLIGERGAQLAERYAGHRVRVLGRVREFADTYEIFSTDPEAITILDVAAPPEVAAAPGAVTAPAPPAGAAAPALAPAPAPSSVVAPAASPPAAPAGDDLCGAARRSWAAAAAAARPSLERLDGCLASGVPTCAAELAAARAALGDVASCAEQVRWRCERGS
jgi:hypothetical protein